MDKNTNNEEIFKKLIEDFLKDAKIETITFDIEDFFEILKDTKMTLVIKRHFYRMLYLIIY